MRKLVNATTVRVKRKPETNFKRGYGIRCNDLLRDGNNRLWAGEQGTVTKRVTRGPDWSQLQIFAEFSGGRELRLAELVTADGGMTDDEEVGEWRVCCDDIGLLAFASGTPTG